MRLRGAIAVVCSTVMAACGGGSGGDEKRVPSDSELDALADTCSESTYDWPATATDLQKVCAGPWQQQCCSMGSTTPSSCKHAHYTGQYVYDQVQPATSCTQTCDFWSLECDLYPGKGCVKLCDSWTTTCTFPACTTDRTVSAPADTALRNVESVRSGCTMDMNPIPGNPTASNAQVIADPTNVRSRTCRITVDNAPRGHVNGVASATGPVNVCDTLADSAHACGWDQTKIGYAACTSTTAPNTDGSLQRVVDISNCPNQGTMYTSPGLALSSVATPGNFPPVCLTCEGDAPLGGNASDAQAQAKFQCMLNRRADMASGKLAGAVAKDLDLDKKLVQNAELLFEFRGSQLSAAQRTSAEGLYTSNPTIKPACSQAPDWAAPSPSCSGALDGKLTMCDRLADAHVSPALALLEASNCIEAWRTVSALPPENGPLPVCTTRSKYIAGWAGISTNELRHAFSELVDTDVPTRRLRLQERMVLASNWYEYLRSVGEPIDQHWRDTGVVAGAIVQGAYSVQLAKLDAAPDVAARNLAMLDKGAADQDLIQAAFTNNAAGQPPLRSAPLLFILANALRATSDRLNEIDFVHDLGCRFRTGCGTTVLTRASQMHSLLSAVADGSKLSTTLPSIPTSSLDFPPGWRAAFQAMSGTGHALIEGAVVDALGLPAVPSSYKPELVTDATVDQVPVYALGSIVNLSRMKADHYAQTGRFRPGETMALETGLLQSKLADVKTVAGNARTTLHADHLSYDANFQKLIDDQLAIVRGANAQANANDALSLKTEQLRQLGHDLDGLRIAATVDLSRFGADGSEYNKLVSKLEESGAGLTPHWQTTFDVAPTEAKFTGGPGPTKTTDPVTNLAIGVGPGPVRALPGTIVQIETQGQWSATCAIGVSASKFNPPIQNYAGAMTGPQGYGLSYTNGHYTTQGQSGQDFSVWDGVNAVVGGATGVILASGVGSAAGAAIAIGAQAALTLIQGLFGSNDHDNHSDGTEYHQTAAFNAALRVPTTPFSAYPAGALLALKMNHLGTTVADLVDVEVVQSPSTTILANSDIDVYLAVNDLSCAPTLPPGKLTVTLHLLEPRIRLAIAVQQAMSASATDLKTRIQQMLLQRRVLATDLESARSQAMTTLTANCGADCTGNAATPFLQYYTNWVGLQLNQAERQIEIGKVERQLRVAAMEWGALAAQVLQADRDSAILGLLPSWAAQNIDENKLKGDTEQLVRVVDRYLYPFLRAKYPETLQGWPNNPGLLSDSTAQGAFARLTSSLDWTSDWGAIAEDTASAYDSIQRILDLADLSFNVQLGQITPAKVAISIPKPIGLLGDVDPNVYAFGYGNPTGAPFVTYTPPYRELDATSSAAIWNAIVSNTEPVKITIPPELLYNAVAPTAFKYDAQLSCGQVLPVIKNMGVFVAKDGGAENDTWNAQPRQLPIHSSVHVNYLSPSGPEPFYGTNGAWLQFNVQPQYGVVKSAPTQFVATGGGQGLSPAGEFTIEAGYRDWLDPNLPDPVTGAEHRHALALVLVLEVELRSSGQSVSWVQQCH